MKGGRKPRSGQPSVPRPAWVTWTSDPRASGCVLAPAPPGLRPGRGAPGPTQGRRRLAEIPGLWFPPPICNHSDEVRIKISFHGEKGGRHLETDEQTQRERRKGAERETRRRGGREEEIDRAGGRALGVIASSLF